jgi:hypothetical protein
MKTGCTATERGLTIKALVNFEDHLRSWDGFGVNYVEACQTRDYKRFPQDYGGFSTLTEEQRDKILDLVFGKDGLKPALVKMFLDPLHMKEPAEIDTNPSKVTIQEEHYDHSRTTRNMRFFVKQGLERTRAWGGDLQVITTLYGPPGWMTRQRVLRGRDLDEHLRVECAKYIASWVRFLREIEGLPVAYASLHNEGEDYLRWDEEGFTRASEPGHDYNYYLSPEELCRMVAITRQVFDRLGLQEVGVTPGETTNWYRFYDWGYAEALAADQEALESLALITSHGFRGRPEYSRYYGDHRSAGIDELRAKRPELHAWVTSTSWSDMDARFIQEMRNNIYSAKVNGIIPWACIQNHALWTAGDPNPGCAFLVDGEGGYQIQKGYYYYIGIHKTSIFGH